MEAKLESEKSKGAPFSWGAPTPTSPWGAPTTAPACVSLAEVMSEELASDLQKKEYKQISHSNATAATTPPVEVEEVHHLEIDHDTSDDFVIAQMLQKQFDKEYDSNLSREESHMNGQSKVGVSLSNYRMVPQGITWDESDEEIDQYFLQDDRKRDWDLFETKDKEVGQMPKTGYKKIPNSDKVITKHDKELTQRANAKRLMNCDAIMTGDGGGFDMQLSNKVYNKIKNFSVKEGKRKNRVQDKEDKAVAEQALDPSTRLLLYKLVNGGVLDAVNGVISTGKEAVIMHADGGPGPEEGPEEPLNVPKECAIKVFKTTLNEFKTRDKYIRDDYRFKDRFSKQNPRKIIHMWAEKELHNLNKMSRAGLRVPTAVVLKKHILVMSFIGSEGAPAPKLKDAVAKMSSKDIELAYQQVVDMMVCLYNKCQLVHADLSEYNILWHEKECWFIDVSQSVEPIHPSGLEFLHRDALNIYQFFSKNGVEADVPHELFNKITGLELIEGEEDEVLSQIRTFQKNREVLSDLTENGEHNNFNYCWEQSQSGVACTPPRPIPGHHKPKRDRSGKSPRSPGGKSPKSPIDSSRSPKSDLVKMTDEDLRKLKISLITEDDSTNPVESSRKPSQIKFQDVEIDDNEVSS